MRMYLSCQLLLPPSPPAPTFDLLPVSQCRFTIIWREGSTQPRIKSCLQPNLRHIIIIFPFSFAFSFTFELAASVTMSWLGWWRDEDRTDGQIHVGKTWEGCAVFTLMQHWSLCTHRKEEHLGCCHLGGGSCCGQLLLNTGLSPEQGFVVSPSHTWGLCLFPWV